MNIKETMVLWFKAARAPFLIISFIPAVLGGIIAYTDGVFDWWTFIIVTVGIVMAHSAADFIDDYFDFKNGNLGNKEQQFHDSPLIDGKIKTGHVLIATLICLVIALAAGVYLLIEVGMPVLYLMLAGTFIVMFYTSPPIRLNYRGLGETMLFFAFGPMIVVGVYLVLTHNFSWASFFASIPLGIFTMNVGLISNIFDYDDDVKSGKKCIPVRYGQKRSVQLLTLTTILAYISVIAGVILVILPLWSLISLITLPLAIMVVLETSKYDDNSKYTPAMGKAIGLSTVMGILLCIAFII